MPEERTRREIEFLRRHLPAHTYRHILDLACGAGRHAGPLGAHGYSVTGVDLDRHVLELARSRTGENVCYVHADMRDLGDLDGEYDAVICLWQSFGYFDPGTNRRVLREVCRRLRADGRLVLDIYNRRFFEGRSGKRRVVRGTREIEEYRELTDRRLSVRLCYRDTGEVDRFEWEVFTLEEIVQVAAREGLEAVLSCSGFDETRGVAEDRPRMQLIFERRS